MPPVSTLAPDAPAALVPVEALFERIIAPAEEQAGTRDHLVRPGARRAAFAAFERELALLPKSGRDWKYDYARIARELPWNEHLPHGRRPEPLIAGEGSAALARSARTLPEAERERRDALAGSVVRAGGDAFASLTTAFAEDGFFVHVPAHAHIEAPILIEHDVAGAHGSSFPYTLIVVDEGARATVVEDLFGSGFASGIVEIVLGERAQLDYVAVQRADDDATVFMSRGIACAAGATGRFFVAELGAGLSRSLLTTRLEGRGAHAEVDALFFNSASQHIELATLAEHAVGDCTSRTVVKSAARERGQGRYFGNIRIAEHANGSDASLRDDALLLSEHAHIDSVPALEIKSNDVKAFHGATIGSIGEDELFYAQSRGIPRADAERMIALGFFDPLVARFPGEALRETVRAALATKAGPAGREPR